MLVVVGVSSGMYAVAADNAIFGTINAYAVEIINGGVGLLYPVMGNGDKVRIFQTDAVFGSVG